MSYHALIAMANQDDLSYTVDTLDSLGHTYDVVGDKQGAMDALRIKEYQYVILGITIPTKAKRPATSRTGLDLVRSIRRIKHLERIPVIAIVEDTPQAFMTANKATRAGGADDAVLKPLEDLEFTLSERIIDMMRWAKRRKCQCFSGSGKVGREFTGGDLVFYPSRVTLNGITVCDDSEKTRLLLDALCEETATGEYRGFSGNDLALRIGSEGGQNSISHLIGDFRRRATRDFKAVGIELDKMDVISHAKHGYHLRDWIHVTRSEDPYVEPPIDVEDSFGIELDENERWIMSQLQAQIPLTKAEIAQARDCTCEQAYRALQRLRKHDLIQYEGGRAGKWKLKGTSFTVSAPQKRPGSRRSPASDTWNRSPAGAQSISATFPP